MKKSQFGRLLRHASILLGGNAAGAVFGFLTGVAAARYLGASGLGAIVMVQSFVLTVDRLVNFQAWRTVIRYGATAQEQDGPEGGGRYLAEVVKFGALLDVTSAATGACIALIGALFASRQLGWAPELHTMAIVYALSIATNVRGTATGVLRMFERFSVFVWSRLAAGPVKLAGVLAAWWFDWGGAGVLAAWIASDIVSSIAIVVPALAELRRRGLGGFWSADLRGVNTRHPGIWRFSWVMNLSTGFRAASREADNFVVGALISVEALGLFKVAKQFAQVLGVVQDPLAQASYPELSRQAARGDKREFVGHLLASVRIAAMVAVPYWLALTLLGDVVIRLTVGPEFAGAVPVMTWYTAALGIGVLGFWLPGATMALGRANVNLVSVVAATVAYFAILPMCVSLWGRPGAGIAYVGFYLVWVTLMMGSLAGGLRAWTPGAAVAEAREVPD